MFVSVEPLVVASVLDHYRRRAPDALHVIGILLGQRVASSEIQVMITDAIAVPIDPKTLKMDFGFALQALQLHQQVYPDPSAAPVLVGWYSTAANLSVRHVAIHDAVSKLDEFRSQVVPGPPILLTVDTICTDSRLQVCTYVAEAATSPSYPSTVIALRPLTTSYSSSVETRTVIDTMIRSQPDKEEVFDSPANLLSAGDGLDMSLANIENSVSILLNYVTRVAEGKERGDEQIGRAISEVLSSVAQVGGDTIQKEVSNSVQDLLMIVYLANIVKLQSSVADKVNLVA